MGRNSKWIDACGEEFTEQVAHRALEARLERVWHYLERSVRDPRGETENVHQLRVFSRRAVGALEIFDAWIPPRRAGWLCKQLKRVRKVAGAARDLDVLELRWSASPTDLPAAETDLLFERVRQCREQAQQPIEAIHEKLIGKRFDRRVHKFLKRVRNRGGAAACQPFACMARDALARLVVPYLGAARAEMADAEALHAFRIQGKQVRYAMEIFAGAFEASFRDQLYPIVADLQDRLGAINDHVTAQSYLVPWRDAADSCSLRHAFEAGIEREQRGFESSRQEFLAWWTADSQSALRNRFAEHLPLEATP